MPKNLVSPFLWRALVFGHFHNRAHHLVDGPDDLQHLGSRDVTVAIKVVHAERPFQFLLEFSARGHGQSADEFAEVDRTIPVAVKRAENVLRKLRRVAIREEVTIDYLEFLDGQGTRRRVLKKALVPLLQFNLSKQCLFFQIGKYLGLQFAVLFSHCSRNLQKGVQLSLVCVKHA